MPAQPLNLKQFLISDLFHIRNHRHVPFFVGLKHPNLIPTVQILLLNKFFHLLKFIRAELALDPSTAAHEHFPVSAHEPVHKFPDVLRTIRPIEFTKAMFLEIGQFPNILVPVTEKIHAMAIQRVFLESFNIIFPFFPIIFSQAMQAIFEKSPMYLSPLENFISPRPSL